MGCDIRNGALRVQFQAIWGCSRSASADNSPSASVLERNPESVSICAASILEVEF